MIGVVGAGVTGLALSWFLEEKGLEHRVFEASDRPGGVVRTTRSSGRVLDHGPQRVRLTSGMARLVSRLGLEDELIRVPPELPLFVYRRGRLRPVPLTPGGFLRTDLLSGREKARFLLEPLTGGWGKHETVAAFLTRKFGSEGYRAFLGPLFGGIFAQDPEEMYVRHALGPFLRSLGVRRSVLVRLLLRSPFRDGSPEVVSFRDGMGSFTDALHASVAHRVHLGASVTGLRRAGVGWSLHAGGEEVGCSRVVLTLPAPGAAELLAEPVPEAADRLRKLRYNELAVVHLHGNCGLEGLGYQVARGEDLRTRGVTWNASALGRRGIHTAFLGGSDDPELLELSDSSIGEVARDEFRRVTGCESRVLNVSRTRIPAWDLSWAALDRLVLPPGLHLCANYESRVGVPGRVDRARALSEDLGEGS